VLRLLATVATQVYATRSANRQLKRNAEYYGKLAIAGLAIFVFAATGVGFAIAALYLSLATVVGAALAALLVAGALLVAAGLIALIACYNAKQRRHDHPAAARPAAAGGESGSIDAALVEGLEALEAAVKRDPKSALLTALVIGLGAGLFRPK